MPKFIKLPKVIEAVQFDGHNEEEIFEAFGQDHFTVDEELDGGKVLTFNTVHGDPAHARVGDWVTPDAQPGTFYPIAPEVMVTTYDPYLEVLNPVTEGTPWDELLGRVRFSLVQTRPMSEVDLITERLLNAEPGSF